MSNPKERFALLEGKGITESEFLSIQVPVATLKGRPIGQGKCKAVVLRFNNLTRNDITSVDFQPIYYGDSDGQEMELLRGETSEVIFATDLSNVYVRAPLFVTDLTAIVYR